MITREFGFGTKQSYESLIQIIKSQKCVLCVGAGLSKQFNKNFPTWSEFLKSMLKTVRGRISKQTFDEINRLIEKNKLLEAAEACRRRLGPKEYKTFMVNLFQTPLDSTNSSRVTHNIITKIPFVALVTTNYDQVLEKIYLENKIDMPIYTENDAPSLGTLLQSLHPHNSKLSNKSEKRERSPNFLLKAHGDLTIPDTWILTANDYRNLIKRNPAYRNLMRTILSQYTFMFLGFGLSDPDFQLLLHDVMDAYEGEIPDHYLLSDEIEKVEQEVLYRTYRIRVIPYKHHDRLPDYLKDIQEKISTPQKQTLPSKPTLVDVKNFVNENSNFEDPLHRKITIGKHLKIIISVLEENINDPYLDIDGLKALLEIERVLTHHVYLFPELKIRQDIAPKLISKARELYEKGTIKNFKALGEHQWMLYMVAIEDFGFPLVRNVKRENGAKSLVDMKEKKGKLASNFHIVKEIFGLHPSKKSEGEQLRAACYQKRIMGLELINLNNNKKTEGIELLEEALFIAQKASWESIEAALLQDIVRPEPNPWGDDIHIKEILQSNRKISFAKIRMKESIELARYKGMHRRVIGGLIGMSLITQGEERIRHLRHAKDYYVLHQVEQEPLYNTLYAEETLALADLGDLPKFEKEKRINWFTQEYQIDKPRYKSLHALYQSKLEKALNFTFPMELL